jgi:hypothetical protein
MMIRNEFTDKFTLKILAFFIINYDFPHAIARSNPVVMANEVKPSLNHEEPRDCFVVPHHHDE